MISRKLSLVNRGVEMAAREYRLRKRAEGLDATRERIVEATAALHREQGVAATSYAQIAERAGVGAATVYRHFPTLGSLVEACGATVWEAIRPPLPADAPAVFAGLGSRQLRLERLVAELDAFYERAADRLGVAARDRDRVPELDAFLRQVEAGVEALVREALGAGSGEAAVRLVAALTDVSVWRSLKRLDVPPPEHRRTMVRLLACATTVAGQDGPNTLSG
jgi:AcrR family transcriptional regulator